MTIRTKGQGGFAMIEIMVSVLLLSIAVLGSLGLQAKGIANISDAKMRAAATLVAERVIGSITTDFANAATYAYTGTGAVPSTLTDAVNTLTGQAPGSSLSVAVTASGASRVVVDITVRWSQKSDKLLQNSHAVRAYISKAL